MKVVCSAFTYAQDGFGEDGSVRLDLTVTSKDIAAARVGVGAEGAKGVPVPWHRTVL